MALPHGHTTPQNSSIASLTTRNQLATRNRITMEHRSTKCLGNLSRPISNMESYVLWLQFYKGGLGEAHQELTGLQLYKTVGRCHQVVNGLIKKPHGSLSCVICVSFSCAHSSIWRKRNRRWHWDPSTPSPYLAQIIDKKGAKHVIYH